VARDGAVATVTLDRPDRLNALDRPLCDALVAALRQVAADAAVRAVVITGAGRAFCAGADLTVLATDGDALVAAGRAVALAIRAAPKPVLAAVNGPAAGGGANLALACDYRIASEAASLGQVFPKLGLAQDWGGSYFLPRLVRPSVALELVWSARMVPAAEALTLGLVDRVVPADRLLPEALALTQVWAAHPPHALAAVKDGVYRSAAHGLDAMLDWEVETQTRLFRTPETRGLIAAAGAARRKT
jgi:enoyl-CoA hydratase/carnithine racemase